jgi:hypothetical protein
MSFDKTTRNRLARFVADARRVIADEFTEQFQSLYGISAKGEITPLEKLGHLDDAALATAALLRERIEYLEKTHPDDKDGTKAAVARLAREQAFTILNRLAAIRMAEKRGLIVESVGQGYQSKGFKVFETVAGSALGDIYHRYRRYLFCLFDELAIDLGSLFDRRSPQALLFPRESALLSLLDLLHAADLERLWAEDETIGWIYQYYNDPEERKKMRAESASPRNSRELAVRNQFFTPRYVVEFLTDNTLGRIWYEMTEGQTRLAEQCRYLVRRPTEIFLAAGESEHLPEPFDQPLDSIIGDPQEAHSRIFLEAPPEDYLPPSSWYAEAFQGNFTDLPEDAGDPWTRWVGAAIPPEQIDRIIGERWEPMENDRRIDALRRSILSGSPDPETRKLPVIWAILSDFALTSQFDGGYGASNWKLLWTYFRQIAQNWQKYGSPNATTLSQEELIKQSVHIPHRPIKDPREIRLLDPACGSMHFGLYAFDLFETIYEEAWDNGSCPNLQGIYASKDEFLKDIPRLIIEHNIHGIDIDPRAVQIAGLSLWLRAQKAWQQQKVPAADRPCIRRSNIVCAEPMPGSPEMLEEFIATLAPLLLGELVKTVFQKMQLAGEAGSLLKIEEEIRTAIDTARKEWLKQQDDLLTRKDGSQEEFFATAEQQVIDALRAYAEQADADSYQRRLFADDAARGFAFIDLCRKRYDAIVMNPPFGEVPSSLKLMLKKRYGKDTLDIYDLFYRRAFEAIEETGRVGAITPRTMLYQGRFSDLRNIFVGSGVCMNVVAEMDLGVLDDATVRPALFVISKQSDYPYHVLYIDMLHTKDPSQVLLEGLNDFGHGKIREGETYHSIKRFKEFPDCRFSFWAGPTILDLFESKQDLEPDYGKVTQGLSCDDDNRFLRCWWEIAPQSSHWKIFGKFDARSTFIADFSIVIDWSPGTYALLGTLSNRRANEDLYYKSGIAFTRSCEVGMAATVLPEGLVFSTVSRYFLPICKSPFGFLAYLNTKLVEGLHLALTPDRDRVSGTLRRIPVYVTSDDLNELEIPAKTIWEKKMRLVQTDETQRLFLSAGSFYRAQSSLRQLKETCSSLKADIQEIEQSIETFVASRCSACESDIRGLYERVKPRKGETDLVTWAKAITTEEGAAENTLGEALGFAFGRWDIRYATGERRPPELSDPFAPLPICPPGMLQNAEGLPAERKDLPADYPLPISWSGILLDDENHPEDIVARVREAIEVIWKERAEAIEQEACGILGVKTLRDYFRRPTAFFADHLKRYSKSRRQAPIYWPLSTKSGGYTLWLYYHRLTDQTLHTCLADFLDPKIRKVQSELDSVTNSVVGGTRAGDLREFLDELKDLRDEIERVIKLPWEPNLNDGVLITASPLWKLFRLSKWQKDLKACWDKLAKGDYDWAHLAYTIRPREVEKACEKDRSIAIAHGLEHLCKIEPPKPKKKRGKKAEEEEPEEDDPQLIEED